MYIQHFRAEITRDILKNTVAMRPYALILNTGSWEFMEPHLQRKVAFLNSTIDCDLPDDFKEQNERAAHLGSILGDTKELSEAASVRLIYRGNHVNFRFGADCADAKLLPLLQAAGWEIWDNIRISQDVWRTQCHDGFHFDRTHVHSVDDHKRHIQYARDRAIESPGMLEAQLSHSLLFNLFRDTIQEFLDTGKSIPY